METIRELFISIKNGIMMIGPTDIIEMIILAVLIYRLLVWVKNSHTWVLMKGLAAVLIFYVAAKLLHFDTILYLINRALDILLIAIIVVFQPELRKALEKLGHGRIFRLFHISALGDMAGDSENVVKSLTDAAFMLSEAKTGALIVIENVAPLDEYIATGIQVDALVSSQLLVNIFENNTPLHDGAVILRGDRVVAATCYLPLSSNLTINKTYGTRHRAAVGVSELTDSLTVVVSEETGRISVAREGELRELVSREELVRELKTVYSDDQKKSRAIRLWRHKNEKVDS